MEQDTLAHLIQLFAQLGGDAKWAFLAYLGYKAFAVLALVAGVLILAKMVIKAVRQCSDDTRTWNAIRALFDASWYEHDKVIRQVTELRAKNGR